MMYDYVYIHPPAAVSAKLFNGFIHQSLLAMTQILTIRCHVTAINPQTMLGTMIPA